MRSATAMPSVKATCASCKGVAATSPTAHVRHVRAQLVVDLDEAFRVQRDARVLEPSVTGPRPTAIRQMSAATLVGASPSW
jgi:hypothetical protein